MRQLHDAARFIAHRSYIAHFRSRKQTLILGIVAGDGMKQIDVLERKANARS